MLNSTPVLAVQHVDDPTPGKNRIHLDLATDDLEATTRDLVSAGASMVEKRSTENHEWTTFTDPQGNQSCVSQQH